MADIKLFNINKTVKEMLLVFIMKNFVKKVMI